MQRTSDRTSRPRAYLVNVSTGEGYRDLAEEAWSWVLAQVRDDDGPWLPESVDPGRPLDRPAADRDCWYSGIAGLAPVLAEVALQRDWRDAERALARSIADRLLDQVPRRVEPSFFDGLAGDVTALRLLEPGSELVAMQRLARLATEDGWPTTTDFDAGSGAPLTDLSLGTAGVVLAAVWAGGADWARIAETGADALLRAADRTEAGLDWGMVPGQLSRGPNYSHGTAGVGAALAVAGAALRRPDLVDAATHGARHLLSVGSLADDGFVVPHTIPPSTRVVEPVTYTWCHGPAGTSYLFAALAHAGVDAVDGLSMADLRARCLRSVLDSEEQHDEQRRRRRRGQHRPAAGPDAPGSGDHDGRRARRAGGA